MSTPSRTSIMVAAARAVGARESDPDVRNPDWLAERILGPEELGLIHEHPLSRALDSQETTPDFQVIGTAMMMIVRTRYIDEKLQRAIQNGATQVVILGAGFDTRAHRFKDLLAGKKVFEVDSPGTQEYKRRRLEAVLGASPPNLKYVTIDFNAGDLAGTLRQAGYDSSQKTFFVWEGVSMYVEEEGIRETLRTIAQSAPGSSLVMDYASRPVIDLISKNADLPQVKYLENWGERWVFGVPEGAEAAFFQELGLEPAEFLPVFGPEAFRRYLMRKDGTIACMPPGVNPWAQAGADAAGTGGTGTGGVGTTAAARNVNWYSLVELNIPERSRSK